MKNNQNGFATVIVVLAAIVALIIGGAAWYYTQGAKPKSAQPSPAPVVDQQPVQLDSADQTNPQPVQNPQVNTTPLVVNQQSVQPKPTSQTNTQPVKTPPATGTAANQSAQGNADQCATIQNESGNGLCYTQIATNKQDASYCEKITFSLQKDVCYEKIATEKRDPSLCAKINSFNIDAQDSCYKDAAGQADAVPACEKATNPTDRDECYEGFALEKKNPLYCDYIKDDKSKNSCISDLNSDGE